MKIYNEIDLYRYNTMKLHSIARIMYEPENVDELLAIFRKLKKEDTAFYLLSAGSNIVFGARIERPIVYLMSFNTNMSFCEDGILECGASVRIQSLLEKIKEFSLGGIEYLASVPSSVGGAVYMNAGRGRKIKRSISDYIESVRYLDIADMQIKNMYGNDGYLYRSSPFQSLNTVILSARFKFIKQDVDIINRLIKERLAYSQRYLNVGFSGGEKKKAEILQMVMLNPSFVMLDETDSGLDIDAVRIVSENVERFKNENKSILIITHHRAILSRIKPDYVHVLYNGKIVKTSDASLIDKIQNEGYAWIEQEV